MLLINDGSIMDRNLRHQRLTRDELEAEPRQQSIGSLGDMRYAGLETNGRRSSRTDGS